MIIEENDALPRMREIFAQYDSREEAYQAVREKSAAVEAEVLNAFVEDARMRFSAALSLLHYPEVAAKVEKAEALVVLLTDKAGTPLSDQ